MHWRRTVVWIIGGAVLISTVVSLLVLRARHWNSSLLTFQGAVLRRDPEARERLPIANVEVTATRGMVSASTRTDASGYYRIRFPEVIWPGQAVILRFRHEDYWPVDLSAPVPFRSATRQLYIATMQPMTAAVRRVGSENNTREEEKVSNIRVRYTENVESEENIGSVVRTFEVANAGNVPCRRRAPCSPDGSWKATTGSVSFDAGVGNEFRSVRASCIAGPCPFTHIDASGFERGGRTVVASATTWSDSATFLVEGEVFRTSIASSVRYSYPVIFRRNLNFTLPPTEEGVSIEAEVNGSPMVFPLGPDLYLSWANCGTRTGEDKSTLYRCELKSGYRF